MNGGSSIWSHEVFVIVPENVVYTNVSQHFIASIHAGCNSDEPINTTMNLDLELADVLAHDSKIITVVGFHLPNCPMVFADDPAHMGRAEDP